MKVLGVILSSLLYVLAFSPFDLKILAIISLILFFLILENLSIKEKIFYSFTYGFFIHIFGVSWVYNSLIMYGNLDFILAAFIILIFIILVSLPFLVLGTFYKSLYQSNNVIILYNSSIFVFCEILKSTFFGGFPWLILGHSQNSTVFDTLYPISGALSVSFVIVFLALSFSKYIVDRKIKPLFLSSLLVSLIILISHIYIHNNPERNNLKKISYKIYQPNIYPDASYNERLYERINSNYLNFLNDKHSEELIILPETILPHVVNSNNPILAKIKNKSNHDNAIISGFFTQDISSNIFNSMIFFTENVTLYNKRKLVPFGEYTPWYDIFTSLSDYIQFPVSNVKHGQENQKILFFKDTHIIPVICFESTFPKLINSFQDDELIVNISNDGWFGDSISQSQHLQINRIRAIEFNRYILRSTNTGISAAIDNKGKVLKSLANNTKGMISGTVLTGYKPSFYSQHGDLIVLMLIFFSIFLKIILKNNEHG